MGLMSSSFMLKDIVHHFNGMGVVNISGYKIPPFLTKLVKDEIPW